MKVLLIQPPISNIITTHLPKYVINESGSYPPLGLMYLASSLEEKIKASVEILDAELYKMSLEEIKKEVDRRKPNIVGITATTFTLIDVINTARAIKELNNATHVCIGGPHTSIYPTETINLPMADSIVIGEGENTFTELVQKLSDNESLENIKGLTFKTKDKRIITNARREFIENLDTIPFPARHLIDHAKYRSIIGKHSTFTTLISSRGCPYNCLYCYHAFGKRYRKHSINYVINEIKKCLNLGIGEFWFFDDIFTIDRKRTIDLCNAIKHEKLDILWDIRTRINLLDLELLKNLRSAGCNRISIGIESGTEKGQKALRKNIDLNQAKEKAKQIKSLGFELYVDFMIGSPGETKQDILKTISFAIELDPDYVQFAITTPFPNTDLYELGFSKGIYKKDYWKEFASNPIKDFKPYLSNEFLQRHELERLLDYAYRKFYFSPKYVIKNCLKLKSSKELLNKSKTALKIFTKTIPWLKNDVSKEYEETYRKIFTGILSISSKGFYDETALPSYTHNNKLIRWAFYKRIDTALKIAGDLKNKSVLDFGSGGGILLKYLYENNCKILACENQFYQLTQDVSDKLGIKIGVCKNIFEIKNTKFDVIFALDVLEHIDNPGRYIDKFHDLASDNTKIIVSGPTENFLYKTGKLFAGFSGHYHITDIYQIEKKLKESGFKNKVLKNLFFLFRLFRISLWEL